MKRQEYKAQLAVIECCTCKMTFAITEETERRLRVSEDSFYCPAGHSQWFGKSECSKLKDKVKNLENSKKMWIDSCNHIEEELKHTKHRLRAEKAAKSRLKNQFILKQYEK